MKKPLAFLTTLVMFGCSSPKALMDMKDGSYDYYALKDALGAYLGKPVKVHIADMEIECTLSGLESDRLIIRQGDRVQEIPVRAISRVELDEVKKSLLTTGTASATGAVLGWLGGKIVSSEVLASQWQKFKTDDKQIAAAAAGATLGFLAGAWLGSKKGSNVLDINPNVEPLILDRAVGRWITNSKREQYGLFADLPLVATESIARVQIFQYGPTDYLIVYDSFEQPELPKYAYDGRAVTVTIPASQMKLSWMAVNRDYLVKEQDKIHKTLNYEEGTLKYRLFEQ
jgi:hypothetical protein